MATHTSDVDTSLDDRIDAPNKIAVEVPHAIDIFETALIILILVKVHLSFQCVDWPVRKRRLTTIIAYNYLNTVSMYARR